LLVPILLTSKFAAPMGQTNWNRKHLKAMLFLFPPYGVGIGRYDYFSFVIEYLLPGNSNGYGLGGQYDNCNGNWVKADTFKEIATLILRSQWQDRWKRLLHCVRN